MRRSTTYNFYLPENTDPIDVNDFVTNFETIDGALLTKDQSLSSTEKNKVRSNIDLGAAATQGVKNNLTTTASGFVLDARQGKTLNDKICPFRSNVSTGATHKITFNLSTTNVHFVVVTAANTARFATFAAVCTTTGTVYLHQASKGNGITIETGTGEITITFASSSSCRINDFVMAGDFFDVSAP